MSSDRKCYINFDYFRFLGETLARGRFDIKVDKIANISSVSAEKAKIEVRVEQWAGKLT